MTKIIDLTGNIFGRWTVLGRDETPRKTTNAFWFCLCECGSKKSIQSNTLRNGISRSCGCLRKELTAQREHSHGHASLNSRSGTYNSWAGMIQRCTNPSNPAWKNYGGRGINVCSRWLVFENFLEDMGDRPSGMSIDRTDNNGNYCRENCKWATAKDQSKNRRERTDGRFTRRKRSES